MAWDSSRPVPWRRLVRDWAIYAAVMAAIFAVFFRESTTAGTFLGLAVSLPIYLTFGGLLAKFGYQRRTMSEVRAESAARAARRAAGSTGAAGSSSASSGAPVRPRPAPTRRTSGGGNRRKAKR